MHIGMEPHVVELRAGRPFDLGFVGDLTGLLCESIDPAGLQAAEISASVDVPLLCPLRPGKIVAVGLNYDDHVRESGVGAPESPLVFAKFPSSVIGPEDAIVIDRELTTRVDWEVELAVVIGRRMRRVKPADALDHVFGYTVANDVSARDVQFADGQWVRGKSLDTFCPLGPVVVTPDEIIFSVAELLAFCSLSFTLERGDVLLTGTPWGCGEFMNPRRSLRPGDIVETEVEGIGVLRNPVVADQRQA
jgi:5-carboxymethyl-2-hydroxymuconate isomerase